MLLQTCSPLTWPDAGPAIVSGFPVLLQMVQMCAYTEGLGLQPPYCAASGCHCTCMHAQAARGGFLGSGLLKDHHEG